VKATWSNAMGFNSPNSQAFLGRPRNLKKLWAHKSSQSITNTHIYGLRVYVPQGKGHWEAFPGATQGSSSFEGGYNVALWHCYLVRSCIPRLFLALGAWLSKSTLARPHTNTYTTT
jgi:hypothetical protein